MLDNTDSTYTIETFPIEDSNTLPISQVTVYIPTITQTDYSNNNEESLISYPSNTFPSLNTTFTQFSFDTLDTPWRKTC